MLKAPASGRAGNSFVLAWCPAPCRHKHYPEKGSTTGSAYVELTAPLVAAANARPGILGLELQASYRYDTTDIVGRSWAGSRIVIPALEGPYPQADVIDVSVEGNQYTLGLRYQPVEQLALRASYGEGVLPPPILKLAPSTFPANLLFLIASRYTDPKRGGQTLTSLAEFTSLGSPDLLPEQSASFSAGMIFTPRSLPGLRLSVDYTKIDKVDEIGSINLQDLINLEDQAFASRITRGPLTPADQALGYTGGPIVALDGGTVNVASSSMEAFDLQLDYTWHTALGEFRASVMGTYQPHLQQQILRSEPVKERVGYNLGPLKKRGNVGLTWARDAWSLGWNMQYYDSYLVYAGEPIDPSLAVRNGSPVIPSQNYHDLYGRYRFGDNQRSRWAGLLNNVELRMSVKNVLDTSPPIVTDNYLGYFSVSPYGDPRLRSYAITLSKSFQ